MASQSVRDSWQPLNQFRRELSTRFSECYPGEELHLGWHYGHYYLPGPVSFSLDRVKIKSRRFLGLIPWRCVISSHELVVVDREHPTAELHLADFERMKEQFLNITELLILAAQH